MVLVVHSVILHRLGFHFCAAIFDVIIETKTPAAVQPRTCDHIDLIYLNMKLTCGEVTPSAKRYDRLT